MKIKEIMKAPYLEIENMLLLLFLLKLVFNVTVYFTQCTFLFQYSEVMKKQNKEIF